VDKDDSAPAASVTPRASDAHRQAARTGDQPDPGPATAADLGPATAADLGPATAELAARVREATERLRAAAHHLGVETGENGDGRDGRDGRDGGAAPGAETEAGGHGDGPDRHRAGVAPGGHGDGPDGHPDRELAVLELRAALAALTEALALGTGG